MVGKYIIRFEVYKKWWSFLFYVRIVDVQGDILFNSKKPFSSRKDAYDGIKIIQQNAFNANIEFICDK